MTDCLAAVKEPDPPKKISHYRSAVLVLGGFKNNLNALISLMMEKFFFCVLFFWVGGEGGGVERDRDA